MIKLDSILDGINSKDEHSWGMLYKICYASLCSYSEAIVADIDCAKDIVQDLMVTVWHSKLHFSTSKELLSYLYRSLYNNSLLYLRNKKNRERILGKIELKQMDDETLQNDFLMLTIQKEVIRLLYRYIEDLPRMRKKIIQLSINGFSGKEIAEKLGISVNTVKVQKNRSIRYLRDRLINANMEIEY